MRTIKDRTDKVETKKAGKQEQEIKVQNTATGYLISPFEEKLCIFQTKQYKTKSLIVSLTISLRRTIKMMKQNGVYDLVDMVLTR